MMDASALIARFRLHPDASERDLKRAYARELKTLDQQTQSEAFQALREAYEALLLLLRSRQADAAQGLAQVVRTNDSHLDSEPGVAATKDSEQPQREAAAQEHQDTASNEANGQAVLDCVVQQLKERKPGSREQAVSLLAECMADPRLTHLEARQFFELGVASILASGWQPGHEFLFSAAFRTFGWREDRSRLLYLGRDGQIVDAAIAELVTFDTQSRLHRGQQWDVVRALRSETRPSTAKLVINLPLAEHVTRLFPHWMHVVSRPGTLVTWRRWNHDLPAWRRVVAGGHATSTIVAAPQRENQAFIWGSAFFFVAILILAVTLLILRPPSPQPAPATGPTAAERVRRNGETALDMLLEHQKRLAQDRAKSRDKEN